MESWENMMYWSKRMRIHAEICQNNSDPDLYISRSLKVIASDTN